MIERLDVFGGSPRLFKLYTQLCFCFALKQSDFVTRNLVVEHVKNGLARLADRVPWVSGEVIQDEDGSFSIVESGRWPSVIVKDLEDELPGIDHYSRSAFPFALLDEDLIAPCKTLPRDFDKPAPILTLQLNFIKGGLLLVINGQHNCMDLRGQSQIIYLLSKACRGDVLTDNEVTSACLPRESAIPLLTEHQVPSVGIPPKQPCVPPAASPSEKAIWAYFLFSSEAMSSLKAAAGKTNTTPFISTDDVLSALVWQSVTRTRTHRLQSATEKESTFERQVDVRKHLGIPEAYPGNVVHKTSVHLPLSTVVSSPLGVIASALREPLLQPENVELQVRTAATRLHESLPTQRTTVPPPRQPIPSTDIKMSSWAKEACHDFDFGGILGRAEAIRRPSFEGWEGLAYMMPRTLSGEIAVALCLRPEDLEALKRDREFARWGRYVG